MLERLLALIGIGGREEGFSANFDFDKAWVFSSIRDKHLFLKWVLSVTPDGAVWSIEGVNDPTILHALREFPASSNIQTSRVTIWPRQNMVNVRLTEVSKEKLAASLDGWNLDRNLIHQHIYFDTNTYFISYDNLHENCTWVTHLFSRSQLAPLIENNVVSIYEDGSEPNE